MALTELHFLSLLCVVCCSRHPWISLSIISDANTLHRLTSRQGYQSRNIDIDAVFLGDEVSEGW
jgi:hypothetical protein